MLSEKDNHLEECIAPSIISHLLAIPSELRFLIYADIFNTFTINLRIASTRKDNAPSITCRLTTQSFPHALFLTCRTIYDELSNIVPLPKPKLDLQADLSLKYDLVSLVKPIPAKYTSLVSTVSVNEEAIWTFDIMKLASLLPALESVNVKLKDVDQNIRYCHQHLRAIVMSQSGPDKEKGSGSQVHRWGVDAYALCILTGRFTDHQSIQKALYLKKPTKFTGSQRIRLWDSGHLLASVVRI